MALLCTGATVCTALADTSDDDDDDYDPLPGRTQEQMDTLIFNFDEVVETVATYASLMSILVILLAMSLSMKLVRWNRFLLLTMASLIWFAFYEQYSTGQFWIGIGIEFSGLIIAGLALASLHFLQAGLAIPRDDRLARARPFLMAAAALPWCALAFAWPISEGIVPSMLATLGCIAFLSHAGTVPTFSGASFFRKRNYAAIALAVVVIAIATLGELDEGFDTSFGVRLLFVAVVGLSTLLLVQQVIAILRERDASIRQSLAAAQREAEQSKALLEAEKNYSRAREAARLHTMRLATASHDIRQPIVSLRATMAAVSQDQPDEVKAQLEGAFDYLDNLASSYLETAEAENAPFRPVGDPQDGREVFSTSLLCDTLERMFRKEAEAKGLVFERQTEDVNLISSPLAITRILSNLLSNAIKHTVSGEVLLGGAQTSDGYVFTIKNSATLPDGFDAQDMLAPFLKGDKSDGHGLGLSIAQNVATKHGYHLGWSSVENSGTEFNLAVFTERSEVPGSLKDVRL